MENHFFSQGLGFCFCNKLCFKKKKRRLFKQKVVSEIRKGTGKPMKFEFDNKELENVTHSNSFYALIVLPVGAELQEVSDQVLLN